MYIMDQTHILRLDLCGRGGEMHHTTDEPLLIAHGDASFIGFIYATDGKVMRMDYLMLNKHDTALNMVTSAGVWKGCLPMPAGVINILHDGNDFDREFGYLLMADFKKNKQTVKQFSERPELQLECGRYRLYDRSEMVATLQDAIKRKLKSNCYVKEDKDGD